MLAELWLNVALQPALQSCPTEISDVRSDGMMCAVVAIGGSDGCIASCVLWLDLAVVPSGSVTVMVVSGDWWLALVNGVTKWWDAPVSRIASFVTCCDVVVGGATMLMLFAVWIVGMLDFVASPVAHFWAFGGPHTRSLPPCLLAFVAVEMWLLPGFLQVMLLFSFAAVGACVVPCV